MEHIGSCSNTLTAFSALAVHFIGMIKICKAADHPAQEVKATKFPLGELPVFAFLAGQSQSTDTVASELAVDQQLGKKILLPNCLELPWWSGLSWKAVSTLQAGGGSNPPVHQAAPGELHQHR